MNTQKFLAVNYDDSSELTTEPNYSSEQEDLKDQEDYNLPIDNLEDNNEMRLLTTDPTSSFVAEFSDGYSFRNMIEYLRVTNTKGNFIFSREVIRYEQADATMTTLNQIEIETCELTQYEFNSRTSEIIMGVNIGDMRAITKTIGKKDSIRLYKTSNDSLLYIQIICHSTRGTRTNVSIVRPIAVDLVEYEFPGYKRTEKYPNCTVPTAEFAKMCTAMSSVKCNYVTVYGLPKGAIFEGLVEGSIFGRIERFGNHDGFTTSTVQSDQSSDNPDLKVKVNNITVPSAPRPKLVIKTPNTEQQVKIIVKMSTIKALAKLNNLSLMGTVKIYMEPKNPLKLVCKIGTYGTLRVFIRSDDDC